MPPATNTLAPAPRKPLTALSGVPLFKLTVEQYQEMVRTGILKGAPKVELIEGYLVEMDKVDPPHAIALGLIMDLLLPLVPGGSHARFQTPITLSASQPQPDAAVVRGARLAFADRHPEPSEIHLVVEISDSSLEDDRTTKLQMYARDRVAVYWIVNIPDRQLEVYTSPVAGRSPRYRDVRVLSPADSVTFTIDTTTIGPILVADLLPPA